MTPERLNLFSIASTSGSSPSGPHWKRTRPGTPLGNEIRFSTTGKSEKLIAIKLNSEKVPSDKLINRDTYYLSVFDPIKFMDPKNPIPVELGPVSRDFPEPPAAGKTDQNLNVSSPAPVTIFWPHGLIAK
jgi:hypothetical protein